MAQITRPTWSCIDQVKDHAAIAEAYANTVAERRNYADSRLARSAANHFKEAVRLISMVEREDEDGFRSEVK
jgi:hypothetical protein